MGHFASYPRKMQRYYCPAFDKTAGRRRPLCAWRKQNFLALAAEARSALIRLYLR